MKIRPVGAGLFYAHRETLRS